MRARILFTSVFFVASCGPELPAPVLETVSPNWAYNGEITEISILGENLYPYVLVNDGLNTGNRFDAQYRAMLQNDVFQYELTGVTLTDYGQINAVVGEGLEAGDYELSLVSPDGDVSINSVPFVVTDSRADHLDIYTEHVVYEVNSYAVVYLSVVDAADQLVESSLPVEFVVTSSNDAAGVVFQDGGLTGFEQLDGAVGVSGSLGADGRGYVVLTSTLPDELELSVNVDGESVVSGDDGTLVFGTGAIEQVILELPSDPFETIAGEQFLVSITLFDRFGNVVENRPADLWLNESCGNYMSHMPVVGQQDVLLAVSAATGDDCIENTIVASGDVVGESKGFVVLPSEPVSFLIEDVGRSLDDGSVMAGEWMEFDLYPVDSYGNRSENLGELLSVVDDKNSLGAFDCRAEIEPVRWNCDVMMEVATTEVTITFEDELGVSIDKGSFSVLPGAPSTINVTSATAIVAGDAFEMSVSVLDIHGNIIEVDHVLNPFSFGGTNLSQVSCNWDSSDSSGVDIFVCREFVANSSMVFTIKNIDLGVSGSSDIVEVVNSDLSYVDISFSDNSITAGDTTLMTVQAYDLWGNPYLVQSDPALQFSDGLGGMSPTTGTLSLGGDLVTNVSLELAGYPVDVEVSQSGTSLGSGSIEVVHGAADSISVNTGETWGWVGETTGVAVTVVDSYGNPVLLHSETVTLFDSNGIFSDVDIDDFTDGVGKGEVFWLNTGLGVSILADGGGISGGSNQMDILDPSCPSPPEPVLIFGGSGSSSEILCLNNGIAATTADFSSSVSGANPIYSYHLLIGDTYSKRTTASNQTVQLKFEGYGLATLVTADTDACGSMVYGEVAIGLDDGSPVGELVTSVTSSSLVAGSTTNGTSVISVEGFDCAGDVASNQPLIVRADLGEVDPGRAVLVESGEGLVLQLDNNGFGSFQYSVESSDIGGDATISIGTLNHASFGGSEIAVSGDDRQPRVLWQTPVGSHLESIDEVVVQMNESILPTTISESSFILTESNGDVVSGSIAWDASEYTVTITPDSALNGTADSFNLRVLGLVRDDNGNFLDGDYSGDSSGSAWEANFGLLIDEGLSLNACSSSSTMFYPDGDESGLVSQQDSVTIQVGSAILGTYVVMEVYSEEGDLVRTERQAVTSLSPEMSWDGRGELGLVQASGVWSIEVYLEDISGNTSDVCSVDVALRQNIMDY